MISVYMIMACTIDGGIGIGNKLPWNIPTEMKKFREITTSTSRDGKMNAVIMGRGTWESMGKKPLKNRLNIVLSSTLDSTTNGAIVRKSISDALIECRLYNTESIFIIGGANIYNEFLKKSSSNMHPYILEKIYMSVLYYDKEHKSDTFVNIDDVFKNFHVKKDTKYSGDNSFASFVCYNKLLDTNSI